VRRPGTRQAWTGTGAFPNPTLGASAPRVFSSLNGSSTATYGSFTTPSRGDQADRERAVERGGQGDGDAPTGRHRMIVGTAVMSALQRQADVVGAPTDVR